MCLLVNQPAGTEFDLNFIKGVYHLNSDGLGVMHAANDTIFINRIVPNTERDFVEFFMENIQGKQCAWHARMKTHGHIDLTNCHPYQVISADEGYPIYLAHNGVLSTGNAKDVSKSDTWHYIQDYLRPILLQNPKLFMEPAFQKMLGAHIGSGNKFILMDAFGNTAVINEYQGVEHQGAWLSNTYAWDTSGTKYDYKSRGYNYGGGYSRSGFLGGKYPSIYSGFDDYDEYDAWGQARGVGAQEAEKEAGVEAEADADEVERETLDFCCDLFESIREMKLDDTEIPWSAAEQYYKKAGMKMAYEFIDCIYFGAYTSQEIQAEIFGLIQDDSIEVEEVPEEVTSELISCSESPLVAGSSH